MKQNQLERMGYSKPEIETIRLEAHSELMDTSFPSQHNPGQHGIGPSSAKQGWFDEEDEDESLATPAGEESLWD
ncbi:hypothetical protein [Hoylesella enoeca]|uniref:Uncharacterized protein n=1 Tax=Hoylesella enoeca TaxID=76123 RepID=A0A0S2KLP2_9BACT|nr:hypothetical protein [Hoylesella enoeca]ALO49226.1 hypothetical protein AS203_09110 [Hoylesella enoeca]